MDNWKCLECGKVFVKRTLSHLKSHNMTILDYDNKYHSDKKNKKIVKRNSYTKASDIKCKECGALISSYNMSKHIINKHGTIDQYISKHGEYRKQKLELKKKKRNSSKVKCEICNNFFSVVGMSNHLRDSHYINTEEYVKKYNEFRPNFLKLNNRKIIDNLECVICKKNDFFTKKSFTKHLKTEHSLTSKEYAIKYIFNGVKPKCKCGCGRFVRILHCAPWCSDFISGHNPNGMIGKKHSKESREKMSYKAIKRICRNDGKHKDTTPEIQFKKFLESHNIKYIQQKVTEYGAHDFYLIKEDLTIEIDGTYWHPINISNLNMQLLQSVINDFKKSKLKNLIRIRQEHLPLITSIDDIYKYDFKYDYTITYYQKIITKKILIGYNVKILKKIQDLLYRIIKDIHPEFPKIESKESLNDVINKLNAISFTSNMIDETTFNNNCSSLGVSYLKSKFNSYWKSNYKGNKSPIECWYDDDILYKVIGYRIGLNNSKETFDFSLHQIIRGISALRKTISFFKPALAVCIYEYFLGDTTNPIVLDPCAGFGGRMLAFKSKYPNGTYIGIEPNIETYNELVNLSKNFTNVILINSIYENVDVSKFNYDLAFTSIPFYDLESYSNSVNYKSHDEWKKTFLIKILSTKNLILNIKSDLLKDCNGYTKLYKIKNSTSHFNKKQNIKYEYLLKF